MAYFERFRLIFLFSSRYNILAWFFVGVCMFKRLFLIICSLSLCVALSSCATAGMSADAKTVIDDFSLEGATTESESVSEEVAEVTSSVTSREYVANSDTLVVVFSCTGNTKAVAEHIVSMTGADFYEILPFEPYSEADCDWTDANSRSSIEQNDPDFRPQISGDPISLEGYSIIFIGYPIWFSQAPRIMDTFVESYDFGDAVVIPFCTSGSSGIGQSAEILAEHAGSGRWLEGQRFAGDATEDEIREWLKGITF